MQNNHLSIRKRYRLSPRSARQKMKKQRENFGFCCGDVWNMDTYLLELIPSMLRELAATTHSTPLLPEVLTIPEGQTPTIEDYYDGYVAKLKEIASQFEAVLARVEDIRMENHDIKKAAAYCKKTQTMLNKAFKELSSIFFDLWD